MPRTESPSSAVAIVQVHVGERPPTDMLACVPGVPAGFTVALLPTSLHSGDTAAALSATSLAGVGVRSRIVAPRPPARALLRLDGRSWHRLDHGLGRLDRRAVRGVRIGVVDVAPERPKGPFALDLASHFLHPLDRARLVVAAERSRRLAEIAAGAPLDGWLVTTRLDRVRLWLATTDPIAAELWSLALADRFLPVDLERRGPWEDPTVQRATELELGVRIPAEMRLDLPDADVLTPGVAEVLTTGSLLLGMPVPNLSSST